MSGQQLPLVALPLSRGRTPEVNNVNERNVRQRVEMPPAPTPTTLAAMPPQVVEVLVEQAALAARAAPNPPEAICEWMKAFCTALGAQTCPDDLFRRALAAWGFVPVQEATREAVFPNRDPTFPGTYVNLRGEQVPAPAEAPPPAWAGFGSWRSLFAGLCEAWYGRRSRLHEDYEHGHPGSMWIDATSRLTRRHNTDQAEIDQVKARFVNLTMSQREKDTLIDSLLTHVDWWVGAVAGEEWPAKLQSGEGWGEDEFEGFKDMKLHTYWFDWRTGINLDVPNCFRNESGPWRAVVALLVMRGARVVMPTGDLGFLGPLRPVQWYQNRDVRLYRLVVYAQRGQLDLNEENLEDVRDLLEEDEADPNRNMNLLQKGPMPHWQPTYELTAQTRRPPLLIVAIWMRKGPLVKLLLKFGATSAFVGPNDLLWALLANMGMPGWTVEKEDAMKLLNTLREELEQLDRDTRATPLYDGVIHDFVHVSWPANRDAGWPPVPDWMRNAVLRLLGPGPTPQA